MRICFTIPHRAVPKARPRVTKTGHTFTPERTRRFEKTVKLFAQSKCNECLESAVAISITFRFAIPKSWTLEKRARARLGEIQHTTKPDLDNLVKTITDALNGIAYKDDSQIVELNTKKAYSDEDCIEITIQAVGDTQ